MSMRFSFPLAICVASMAFGLVPALATGESSPYLRSVSRLDAALRVAIERQPEGLAKSLAASERVCALGQEAEARGDVTAAAADWSTLSQAVEVLDEPGLAGVERAFANSAQTLSKVESTFSEAWRGQSARLRELRRGSKAIRQGIGRFNSSFTTLRSAFSAWREHRCEAALASINTFAEAIPPGVRSISRGMERLWIASQ